MDHLNEIELIELAGGRSSGPARDQAQRHLDACADCARRLGEYGAVNDALTGWRDELSGTDVVPGLLAELKPRRLQHSVRFGWRAPLQVAASLIVSVGIGHVAARSTWRSPPDPGIPMQTVEATLQLAFLADDTPADLTLLFAEELEPQEATP